MSKLLSQVMSAATTTPYIRQIDNHYHAAMIAENTHDLVDYQRALLRLQVESTAANVGMMREIALRQNAANDLLGEIREETSAVREAIEHLDDAKERGLTRIAARLIKQQEILLEIAEVLRKPYETQALEIRNQADKWLKSGMRHTGREREDDYTDTMRLLREVTKNPIGNQDCVTWFQIGWLLWKHKASIAAAEQSFYRAARLSEERGDLYHVLSVRHQSHMQYLQGRHQDAYVTIQKILRESRDPETLYDGARYAAKTGRTEEAIGLLDICIDVNPVTHVSMFTEEDFR